MNPERARIQADLRGLIEGEVFCDDLFLQMYSTDASILQMRPMGVVRPRSVDDVVAVVQYASENHLPLHARGSGSNVVGAALGNGLVLDFSVHMRRVVSDGDQQVRVQPGVVLANLNRLLAKRGMMFGPDPPQRSVTTVGGVISMDASGSHWMKYGSPREKIRKLQVVLADGTLVELGAQAGSYSASQRIADQIDLILARRQQLFTEILPDTPTNHAGYNLTNLTRDGRLDLTQLVAGSEGTLALITEATLEIQPRPEHRGVVLLFFDQLQVAAEASLEVLNSNVAACDLLDRRLLSIARTVDRRFEKLIPAEAEAMVLVEIQAENAADLRHDVQAMAERMTRKKRMAFDARTTCTEEERNFFWRIVRRGVPMQFGIKGDRQALPFVEDIALDPQRIPDFLTDLFQVLNECEVTACLFAHMGQGIIHLRPQLDLSNEADVQRIADMSDKLFSRVLELRGSISGSHGDGIIRTGYLRRQYGRLYDVFGEIKREFDPQNIFNPGKIVDSPPLDPIQLLRKTKPPGQPIQELESTEQNGKRNNGKKAASKLTVLQPQ
ncbi:MAG: FAD-binding oxidoreductase, partial [Pirellulaceae bacterium]